MTHHLVGLHEIAQMLGVTRQRVDQISRSDEQFPKPIAELASGRIWGRADVERWAARNEREPGVPKGPGGRGTTPPKRAAQQARKN